MALAINSLPVPVSPRSSTVVFQREIYAIVSLAVCGLFLSLRALGVDQEINTVISFAAGLSLRLAAIYFSWSLPTFAYDRRWD